MAVVARATECTLYRSWGKGLGSGCMKNKSSGVRRSAYRSCPDTVEGSVAAARATEAVDLAAAARGEAMTAEARVVRTVAGTGMQFRPCTPLGNRLRTPWGRTP